MIEAVTMNKKRLIVGQEYMYTEVVADGSNKKKKSRRVVECIGIYLHHARFDFGKYKKSLIWFDINRQISEL